MLKFLFRGRRGDAAVIETQRQVLVRIQSELNDAIDALPEKPKVTLDPSTGHLTLELPEQLPDEALALPAPENDALVSPAIEEVALGDDAKKIA